MDVLKPEAGGNPKAVQVRIKPASAARVGGQRVHDLRIGPQPDYVDRDMASENRVLVAPLTGSELRAISEERRRRRATQRAMKANAGIGMVGIITFGHDAQPVFERLDRATQDAAYRAVAEAVAERLNTTLTGLVVHGDESAPHAHFQFPGYDRDGHPLSDRTKRATLRDVQTIAAEVMGRYAHSIERGHSKIGRLKGGASPAEVVNRSVHELHDALPQELAELRVQIDAAQAKAAKNEALAAKARQKAQEDEERAEKALKRAETYERRAEAAREGLSALEAKLARTEALAQDRQRQLDTLASDLARAEDAVAQKKTRIASLQERLRTLSAA